MCILVWDSTLVRKRTETFLVRVRRPLPNRHVLKLWDWRQTISANGKLGLLQMVSESDTRRSVARMLTPKEVDCEIPHRLERGTKHSFMWEPLPNRGILKLWGWRYYVMGQSEQYLLVLGMLMLLHLGKWQTRETYSP